MPEDNDTEALRLANEALFAMEKKCRKAGLDDRLEMARERQRLWDAYDTARDNLIASGVIVGDAELDELARLTEDLKAATKTNDVAQIVLQIVGHFARIAAA